MDTIYESSGQSDWFEERFLPSTVYIFDYGWGSQLKVCALQPHASQPSITPKKIISHRTATATSATTTKVLIRVWGGGKVDPIILVCFNPPFLRGMGGGGGGGGG